MFLDGADGRIARAIHAESAFGAEYDSLADMVAFGAAPAFVIYQWTLHALGLIGWAAALIYCTSVALRLARFNTTLAAADKRWFQGLPCPAAAALIAGFVWSTGAAGGTSEEIRLQACGLAIFAGLTMVSNFRYYSGKNINLQRQWPIAAAAITAVAISAATVGTARIPTLLFGLLLCYALSGYLLALLKQTSGQR
jgi:CDP-diacylglycerol--serine O-phosphatidyltransferase